MAKLSIRPSLCLPVRRVPLPYYTRHPCVSLAFLLVMCIVVDNDIRLVTVTVLVPSNLCAWNLVTIAASSSFTMNTITSKRFLHHYLMIHTV